MRLCIPKSGVVNSVFRLLEKRLVNVRKEINAAAAKEMKAGKYEGAQEWMEVGRSVADFAERVSAFSQEWKRLVKAARIVARPKQTPEMGGRASRTSAERTPGWKFCAPALKVLLARGGIATFKEMLSDLEGSLAATLTQSDKMMGAGSVPRWHREVHRAYRECQREGWIEKQKSRDGVWKITAKGRAIADGKE